jgi:RND family efflux transporter MFP subunit
MRTSMKPMLMRKIAQLITCLCPGLLTAFTVAYAAEVPFATGLTEPVHDLSLSLAVPGIVSFEGAKEGDFVRSNAVILELDKRLEELEVQKRKLIVENRKADWEGTKMVYDKGASVSREELLNKETEYKVALNDLETALQQLQRRSLVAPRAGVITRMILHAGEACSAYQPVVRLVDARECYFVSNVEAKAAGKLKTGQTVKLEIEGASGSLAVQGRIVFISPVVDRASALQRVKVLFDNSDGQVCAGVAGRILLE